jgi:hypothetical protein
MTAAQTAPPLPAIIAWPGRRWRPRPEPELADVAERWYQPPGWATPYRSGGKREPAETKGGALYGQSPALVSHEDVRPAAAVMSWHVQHADLENAIKGHKSGFGWEKLPTQRCPANWASLLMGQLAFNRVAWVKRVVRPPSSQRPTSKPMRHHLLNLAGKMVHTARQCFLVISKCSRYRSGWQFAIKRLAALQFA